MSLKFSGSESRPEPARSGRAKRPAGTEINRRASSGSGSRGCGDRPVPIVQSAWQASVPKGENPPVWVEGAGGLDEGGGGFETIRPCS